MAATQFAMYQQNGAASVLAAFPETGTAQALDLLQIVNPSGAVLAKVTAAGAVVGGSTGSAVFTAAAVSSLVLTQSAVSSFVLTAVVGATAVYAGTITGGAANAFVGKTVIIAGFTNSGNNGTFVITASDATHITVAVTTQVDETHAGTAQVQTVSLTTYTGTITGGGTNNFAGKSVKIAGFSTSGNNGTFTIVSNTTTTIVVTTTTQANETHAGTAQVATVSLATYTGTVTGGGANALAGATIVVAGFAASSGANNGTFTVVSSTATTIVVTTTTQVAETHAGTGVITLTSTANGTRIGKFLCKLDNTATIAALFANAFNNPQQKDILQVVNVGGNVSYYVDYLGVAHGS